MTEHAYITTALDFTDTINPWVGYSNPHKDSSDSLEVCISLDGTTPDIPFRSISKTGEWYTFSLTSEESATLRNSTVGARVVYFILKETLGGSTYYDTKSVTFAVTDEDRPRIIYRDMYRCDNNGTRSDNGNKVFLSAAMEYSNSPCVMRFRSKEEGASTYGAWDTLSTTNDEFLGVITGTFDVSKGYQLQLGVVDSVGKESYITLRIPTEDILVHFGEGGKAIGIGKRVSDTDSGVIVGWEATFDEGYEGTHKDIYAEDILSSAFPIGNTPIYTDSSTQNLPNTSYAESVGNVRKRPGFSVVTLISDNGQIAVNIYKNSIWGGWKYITPQ